jgi:large subunit ribosomal protein L30
MQSLDTPKIKVTLLRSLAGQKDTIRLTLHSLGLRKIGSSKTLPNVNSILGQINKVIQFVKVESV